MRRIIRQIFGIYRYDTVLQRTRARMIYMLLAVMVLFMTAYSLLVPQWGAQNDQTLFAVVFTAGIINNIVLLLIGFYVLAAATFAAVRSRRLTVGAWLLLATWFLGGVWLNLLAQPLLDSAMPSVAILLLLAGLLTNWRGTLIVLVIVIASMLLSTRIREPEFVSQSNMPTLIISTVAIGLTLYLFQRYARESLSEGVSQAIGERLKGAEVIAQLTQAGSQRLTAQELAQNTTAMLIKTFDQLYQARIYLTDISGYEVQLAGDQVRKDTTAPLQTADRASIGGLSLIGQAMGAGKPQISLQGFGFDAAFPMFIGRQPVGVLNIRSESADYLHQQHVVASYQLLANAIALSLDASKQYEAAQQRAAENRHIQEQVTLAQREVQRLSQRLTGGAWSQFLREGDRMPSMSIDFETEEVSQDTGWTPTLNEAVNVNQLVQEMRGDRQVVAVPLRVRGQVIGAMEFELDENREFAPEDYELLQEVSERFGLAVENTRLVKESQRIAQRETFINQISARLQQANDVQAALEEAARGLREAMRAGKVSIVLGDPDTHKDPINTNGSSAQ